MLKGVDFVVDSKAKWLSSRGGPFALMGSEKCKAWGGDEFLSNNVCYPPVGNDYTRACRFSYHEGILSDNDGEAFIFFSIAKASRLLRLGEEFLVVAMEYDATLEIDVFEKFDKSFLNFDQRLFEFYISEPNISLISSVEFGDDKIIQEIEVNEGWYLAERFNLDFGNAEKFGSYIAYKLRPVVYV
jgi:hypothetical protein